MPATTSCSARWKPARARFRCRRPAPADDVVAGGPGTRPSAPARSPRPTGRGIDEAPAGPERALSCRRARARVLRLARRRAIVGRRHREAVVSVSESTAKTHISKLYEKAGSGQPGRRRLMTAAAAGPARGAGHPPGSKAVASLSLGQQGREAGRLAVPGPTRPRSTPGRPRPSSRPTRGSPQDLHQARRQRVEVPPVDHESPSHPPERGRVAPPEVAAVNRPPARRRLQVDDAEAPSTSRPPARVPAGHRVDVTGRVSGPADSS